MLFESFLLKKCKKEMRREIFHSSLKKEVCFRFLVYLASRLFGYVRNSMFIWWSRAGSILRALTSQILIMWQILLLLFSKTFLVA